MVCLRIGEGLLQFVAVIADLDNEQATRIEVVVRFAQEDRVKSSPSSPLASSTGSRRYSSGRSAIDSALTYGGLEMIWLIMALFCFI